ncbi:DUF7344 domain-containing protein [Haloarcula marina]|uniref:DUF7344 domain-containing protein n=1 Tax=Haloarcula marina TaxID=2961574 RepID=UPI0020B64270|nr:hypothetical protein [Halomicroarcula marina]
MDAYLHAPTIPVETALDILRNDRRRAVLAAVTGTQGPHPLAELATEVAAVAHGKSVADVTPAEHRETKILLHHVDLPKLDAAGMVSYDPEENVAESDDPPLVGDDWLEVPPTDTLSDDPVGGPNR